MAKASRDKGKHWDWELILFIAVLSVGLGSVITVSALDQVGDGNRRVCLGCTVATATDENEDSNG